MSDKAKEKAGQEEEKINYRFQDIYKQGWISRHDVSESVMIIRERKRKEKELRKDTLTLWLKIRGKKKKDEKEMLQMNKLHDQLKISEKERVWCEGEEVGEWEFKG